jgi:hypothetical protein
MDNKEYPSGTNQCPCCDGKRVQTKNDGIKIICPACGGTGIYPPPVFISRPCREEEPYRPKFNPRRPRWPRTPYPYELIPHPNDRPYPWKDDGYYVGDDPNDWHGPPKVIC